VGGGWGGGGGPRASWAAAGGRAGAGEGGVWGEDDACEEEWEAAQAAGPSGIAPGTRQQAALTPHLSTAAVPSAAEAGRPGNDAAARQAGGAHLAAAAGSPHDSHGVGTGEPQQPFGSVAQASLAEQQQPQQGGLPLEDAAGEPTGMAGAGPLCGWDGSDDEMPDFELV
jgi:hypothetical protein